MKAMTSEGVRCEAHCRAWQARNAAEHVHTALSQVRSGYSPSFKKIELGRVRQNASGPGHAPCAQQWRPGPAVRLAPDALSGSCDPRLLCFLHDLTRMDEAKGCKV